ncbi:Leucine rich repeat-containing protein [Lachnospiraceae bacterium]|nr:Leucine rich repeat-containing protein [Lachnospiraceae bacterium]
MRKRSLAIILAASMIFGSTGAVMADEFQIEDKTYEESVETDSFSAGDSGEDNSAMIAAHPELSKYVRSDGSIDYVAMDMDILPELQGGEKRTEAKAVSLSEGAVISNANDDDENTYTYDKNSGQVTATGSNTIHKEGVILAIDDVLHSGEGEDAILNKYVKILYANKDIEGFYENLMKRRGDALTQIYVEDKNNLDQIGRSAFKQNPSLTKLYVGTPKTDAKGYEISHKAFYMDTALSDVTLNAAFHVGQRAFYGDKGISSIAFSSLHHMRGDAFEGCTGLQEFKLDGESNYFYTDDGMLYKKYCPYFVEKNGLYNIVVPGLMSVPYKKVGETFVVKKGTRTVAFAAVAGMDQMKTAKISSGVKIVGPRAFYNAPNMKSLYISKSVKHIGNEAFSIFDTNRPGSNDAPYADYDDAPYALEDEYYEAFGGKFYHNEDDGTVSTCNVTDVYYSGTEEEWKQIRYDRYDDSANYYEDAGTVAEHMESVGLSSNVVIHYNSTDPDILMPDFVDSKGVISSHAAVMTAGSKKITFSSTSYGFTPVKYSFKALEKSPAKGIKISKKGELSGKKAGSYEVTLEGASGEKDTVYIFVEKPVMKKLKLDKAGRANISQMLTGTTYLEPTKYESKKKAVATIDDQGNIEVVGKGTSKITVYFGKKKYKANVTLKIKKEKSKK